MEKYRILNVKTQKNTLKCLKFGEGEKTMVILPGLSLRSVINSAKTIVSAYSLFTKDYTVYLFDRAQNIPEGYDVSAMAQDTFEAIDRLGLSDVYLFGVSQGGAIAQTVALKYKELVKKLVLASTFSRLNVVTEGVLREWVKIAETGDHRALNRRIFDCIYSEKTLKDNAFLFESLSREGSAEDCERFCKLALATKAFDLSDDLDKIACPTLVLGAKNDKVVPENEMRYISDKIGCGCYLYDEYGHAVYDEAPDFKERIAKFFGE